MRDSTHTCPGGCGTPIHYQRLACRRCWRRLPRHMKSAITRSTAPGMTADRLQAVSAALTWYGQHLPGGTTDA